jgi:peptidoglycan/xylan/chitin deacetylase (PgdA/CDA1 family)
MFRIRFHLRIYRYELIMACIILLLTGSVATSSRHDEPAFPPIRRYPYRIALTFDDGPHPEYASALIRVLKENDAQATFFVVGKQAVEYPYLLKNLSLAGHEIENHTFTHPNLSKISDADVRRELFETARVIKDITGIAPRFYRPPGGQFNAEVQKSVQDSGLSMALWTVFPKDHEVDDPAVIVRRVLEQANDGGVVLLHSGRDATLVALPTIIRELRDKGYRFVTIAQLADEPNPQQMAWLRGGPDGENIGN